MTIPGITDDRIASLAAAIEDRTGGGGGDDVVDAVEAVARAAWTCLAEPGDGAAGGVVTALGAVETLRLLSSRASRRRVEALCAERDLGEVTEAVVAAWASGVARWTARFDPDVVVAAVEAAAAVGARFAVPGSPSWPARVGDLGVHAPIGLWVRGLSVGPALDRSIALVGARAATGYGEHVTLEAASGLVGRGFVIVSGAAYGIDGMAHRAALADGGTTVAFLAGGVDRPYPSGHASLIARIATAGSVYSEVPCGATPTKWRFLQRNRLIAATASATVVMEAGGRSGSLNTAGHAASLGRPLGAVPGPVTSAASAGCHRLLREYDATCVTSAAEMAELADPGLAADGIPADGFPGDGFPGQSRRPAGRGDGGAVNGTAADSSGLSASTGTTGSTGSERADRVRRALGTRRPSSIGHLAEATGLSRGEVQGALGLLDVQGLAEERDDGWVRR
jgi:DNA processing protein